MFKGLFTAIVTPFDDKDNIDYDSLSVLLQMQIDAKVDGIVVLGTTGESPTIKEDERNELVKFVINKAKGKTKIIVGSGTNSTEKSVQLSEKAEKLGADGLLVVNPYYNKPTQNGLYEHFKKVANSVKIPVILYNIKGRTSVNLETETLLKLSKTENIVSVKEASGDIDQIMNVISKKPKDFTVLSGDDALCYSVSNLGGDGVISVLSNVFPKQMKQLVDYLLDKNYDKAKDIHYNLLPFMKAMFIETNPIPVKTVLAMQGKIKEIFRLPMCNMLPANKEKLKQIFKDFL